jgi:hypothetical protein
MSNGTILSPSLLDRGIFSLASFLADGSEGDRLASDFLMRLLPIKFTRCVKTLSRDHGCEIFPFGDGRPERRVEVRMPSDHLLFDLPDLVENAMEYCWTKRRT